MFKLINSCRLCRSYDNINTTLDHIDSDNLTLFQKFNRIAPGILETNTNLPDHICTNCITELNISYKFINKCSKSQAIFQRYLEQLQNGQQVKPANNREILIKVIKLEESNCNSEVNSFNSVTVKDEKETGFLNEEICDKYNVNDYTNENFESNQADFVNDIKVEEDNRLANLKNEDIEEICNDPADGVQTGQRGNEVKLENNYSPRPFEELKHLYDEDDSEFTKIEDRIDSININIEYGFTDVKNIKIDEDDFENDIGFTGFDLIECDLANGYKVKYDLKLQSLAKEINKEHTKNVNKVLESSAIGDNSSNVNINIQLNNVENIKNVHTALEKSSTRKISQNSSKDSSNVKVNNRSCTVRAPYMFRMGKKARKSQSDITRQSKRNYKCNICGKCFKGSFALTSHIRTHTGEKPFQCKTCNKAFAQKAPLKLHIRIHTGEKPFQCKMCKKTFARNGYLINHIRAHTNEKPYQCKTCKKSFVQNASLIQHTSIHTGEKPFQCKMCKKTFARNDCLINHIRGHTGERPYQCKSCKREFKQNGHLQRHVRTCLFR